VTLLAAGKTRTPAELLATLAAGITDWGENYVQELLAKREAIDKIARESVTWHFIGHLQRNKVRHLVPGVSLIHSVDSFALAREIDKRAAAAGCCQPVLLEVKTGAEETKFGIAPTEVGPTATQIASLPHVEMQGLMTMPPYSDDPETSRPFFQEVAHLARELQARDIFPRETPHLSMGMSGDFEVAVEEGATLVRLGTVLFGARSR
jgi:pyridoxal phosphate enzyme (YggS family)